MARRTRWFSFSIQSRTRLRQALIATLGLGFVAFAVASIEYEERVAPSLARLGQALGVAAHAATRLADPTLASASARLLNFIAPHASTLRG